MSSLKKCSLDTCQSPYQNDNINHDGSVRNSTVATDASTTCDDSSKRSQLSLSVVGWGESPEMEFTLDESLTDCSKLSSDCGSFRNAVKHHDLLNGDHKKQGAIIATSSPHIDSRPIPTVETFQDSFFISYESNLARDSMEDDTTASDELLQYTKLKDSPLKIPQTEQRGRSVTKNEFPMRRRSADATCRRSMVSQQMGIETNSHHRYDPPSNARVRTTTASTRLSETTRPTNHECHTAKHTTLPSRRRASSISRTPSFNDLELPAAKPSRFVRSKRKSITSRKLLTSSTGSDHNKIIQAELNTSFVPAGRRSSSSSKNLMHSHSMPIGSTHSQTCQHQMKRPEEKVVRRLSRCESSPYELGEMNRPYSNTNAPTVSNNPKQKVVHPLTAKLLAESRTMGQAPAHMHTKGHVSRDVASHRNDVPSSRVKLDGVKKSHRHNFETRRRLEKQNSMPESPIRKAKCIQYPSSHSSSHDPRSDGGGPQANESHIRPTIAPSHSFPESPSRRSKPLKLSSRITPDRHGYDNIKDLSRQFNIELGLSSQIQSSSSSSGRRKRNDHPNGPSNVARSEHSRNSSGCNTSKDADVNTNERRRSSSFASSRRDETNVAISNYFTPRHPTPLRRYSDAPMNNENPDDSAFWHIDPNAFESIIDWGDTDTKDKIKKQIDCSINNERFI